MLVGLGGGGEDAEDVDVIVGFGAGGVGGGEEAFDEDDGLGGGGTYVEVGLGGIGVVCGVVVCFGVVNVVFVSQGVEVSQGGHF